MRFNAIFVRVTKELLRDKRTLALMLLAPVLVLTLMYFIFNTNNDVNLKVGVDENVPNKNEDPSNTGTTKQLLGSAIQKNKLQDMAKVINKIPSNLKQGNSAQGEQITLDNHYLYGDADSTYFDKMFPILIGFFVFFFVFLISGIALLRERTKGTLERLLATAVKRSEIVFGYLAGYGMFAVL